MSTVRLVRHGQASGGYAEHRDPGLSEAGRQQAEAAADQLQSLEPTTILTSPLRRAQETAQPLARRWSVEPVVAGDYSEIPSPTDDLQERGVWLSQLFQADWDRWPDDLVRWRAEVADALSRLDGDAVIFTHYIPIVVAVTAATGSHDPDFQPYYCSITTFEVGDGELKLVELGAQGPTVIR